MATAFSDLIFALQPNEPNKLDFWKRFIKECVDDVDKLDDNLECIMPEKVDFHGRYVREFKMFKITATVCDLDGVIHHRRLMIDNSRMDSEEGIALFDTQLGKLVDELKALMQKTVKK